MTLIRLFKLLLRKKFTLYILITLVPSLIISLVFAQYQERVSKNQYESKAQWDANFHAMNIENFLGETVGRLEMLATSIKVQNNGLEDVKKILMETSGIDPRFSGFYLADTNGNLLISTNPASLLINIHDRAYFKQAVNTSKTSISEAHIGRVTGRFIVTIATPIVEHGQIEGILCASLRFDKIESTIKDLLKDEMIKVTDGNNQTLINAGFIPKNKNLVKSSMKISQVPWTITASIISEDDIVFWQSFFKLLMILLTITNILYLWFENLLLRNKVKYEREQTEIHKLELIGNLAASTAHEIRNPLTGIKGLVKLLSEQYKEPKAQSYFDVIQTEIDRINSIVSELLVLGKPTAKTLKTYNVNDIVTEIEPIIRSESNFNNVELMIDYSPNELPVSCVKDQLKQVIINLTKNSLQAMPNGGKLSVILERQLDVCRIKVIDSGVGMGQEQVTKAFKPFYTLKKDGSGLGLTVCKRMIESFGGDISLESTINEGTQVEISLPLSNENKD